MILYLMHYVWLYYVSLVSVYQKDMHHMALVLIVSGFDD